ncbi:hypothetical protein BB558_006068 [Smittium angustum]|uniref:PH domain-containing protein n=1 Tax=Smittium angustum TaxID=133377 RepID=A0A2U1IYR1_SMIAN|nr:hypothetical protein BB558_006068 [Smittium angustum]
MNNPYNLTIGSTKSNDFFITRINSILVPAKTLLTTFKALHSYYSKLDLLYKKELSPSLEFNPSLKITNSQENPNLSSICTNLSAYIKQKESKIDDLALSRISLSIDILQKVISKCSAKITSYTEKVSSIYSEIQNLQKNNKLYEYSLDENIISFKAGTVNKKSDPRNLFFKLDDNLNLLLEKETLFSKIIDREFSQLKEWEIQTSQDLYGAMQIYITHQLIMDKNKAIPNLESYTFNPHDFNSSWESVTETYQTLKSNILQNNSVLTQKLENYRSQFFTRQLYKGMLTLVSIHNTKYQKQCFAEISGCGFLNIYYPQSTSSIHNPPPDISIYLPQTQLNDRYDEDLPRAAFIITEKSLGTFGMSKGKYTFMAKTSYEMEIWWEIINHLIENPPVTTRIYLTHEDIEERFIKKTQPIPTKLQPFTNDLVELSPKNVNSLTNSRDQNYHYTNNRGQDNFEPNKQNQPSSSRPTFKALPIPPNRHSKPIGSRKMAYDNSQTVATNDKNTKPEENTISQGKFDGVSSLRKKFEVSQIQKTNSIENNNIENHKNDLKSTELSKPISSEKEKNDKKPDLPTTPIQKPDSLATPIQKPSLESTGNKTDVAIRNIDKDKTPPNISIPNNVESKLESQPKSSAGNTPQQPQVNVLPAGYGPTVGHAPQVLYAYPGQVPYGYYPQYIPQSYMSWAPVWTQGQNGMYMSGSVPVNMQPPVNLNYPQPGYVNQTPQNVQDGGTNSDPIIEEYEEDSPPVEGPGLQKRQTLIPLKISYNKKQ